MARTSVPDFQTANPLYAGSSVTFFTVDNNGVKTTTKASLFDSPVGGGALANPQVLDSDGKFAAPVYIEAAVIMSVAGVHVADHDTGVIAVPGTWRGDWATATVYYPGDTVVDGTNGDNSKDLYRVVSQHTSGVWATDKADATKLVLAVDVSVAIEQSQGFAAAAQGGASLANNAARRSKASQVAALGHETTALFRAFTAFVLSNDAKKKARKSEIAALGHETTALFRAWGAFVLSNDAKKRTRTSQVAAKASETAAAISETNAATSETNASNSETNAATSETNASTSETNAATSETNAQSSEDQSYFNSQQLFALNANAQRKAKVSADAAAASAASISEGNLIFLSQVFG